MERFLGQTLKGRYRLNEIIGIGGMAVVYKAYDQVLAQDVAVKILKDEYMRNDEFRRRFSNESKAITLLADKNIVDIYDEISNYKLIFTKLDETSSYGNLLNIKLYSGADISYATDGQNVPDDIEVFDTQKIVKQLLGGRI